MAPRALRRRFARMIDERSVRVGESSCAAQPEPAGHAQSGFPNSPTPSANTRSTSDCGWKPGDTPLRQAPITWFAHQPPAIGLIRNRLTWIRSRRALALSGRKLGARPWSCLRRGHRPAPLARKRCHSRLRQPGPRRHSIKDSGTWCWPSRKFRKHRRGQILRTINCAP